MISKIYLSDDGLIQSRLICKEGRSLFLSVCRGEKVVPKPQTQTCLTSLRSPADLILQSHLAPLATSSKSYAETWCGMRSSYDSVEDPYPLAMEEVCRISPAPWTQLSGWVPSGARKAAAGGATSRRPQSTKVEGCERRDGREGKLSCGQQANWWDRVSPLLHASYFRGSYTPPEGSQPQATMLPFYSHMNHYSTRLLFSHTISIP